MTKDEFVAGYCQRSDMTLEEYNEYFVALPCACGEPGCKGWATIRNEPLNVRTHNELYTPC